MESGFGDLKEGRMVVNDDFFYAGSTLSWPGHITIVGFFVSNVV